MKKKISLLMSICIISICTFACSKSEQKYEGNDKEGVEKIIRHYLEWNEGETPKLSSVVKYYNEGLRVEIIRCNGDESKVNEKHIVELDEDGEYVYEYSEKHNRNVMGTRHNVAIKETSWISNKENETRVITEETSLTYDADNKETSRKTTKRETLIVYDQNSNMIKCIEYDNDGNVTSSSEYIYDQYGRVIKEITNNRTTIRTYDTSGNQIEYSIYVGEKLTNRWRSEYDKHNNCVRVEYYDSERGSYDTVEYIFKYEYNTDGSLAKQIEVYQNGTVRSEKIYSEAGYVIKLYDSMQKEDEIGTYEYDLDGKAVLVNKVSYFRNDDGTYNENIWSCENGEDIEIVKTIVYDANGEPMDIWKLNYDEHGNPMNPHGNGCNYQYEYVDGRVAIATHTCDESGDGYSIYEYFD